MSQEAFNAELNSKKAGRDFKSSLLKGELLPLLVILAAVLIFLNKMVLSNLILARGDTFLYFYPYWHSAAEALQSGRLPLWNDSLFMGAPFLANSQTGLFYPLNWPLWFTLSTPEAVKASIVLHLMIAGWGAYFAARRCLQLSRSAAVFSALMFALGGYLTAQTEHINQLQGLAWLPWLIAAAGGWQSSGRNAASTIRFTGAVAALLALQILAGHTQTVFISLTALLIWLAVTEFPEKIRNPRRLLVAIALVVAAGALALLVAGLQTAPTFELLAHSSREGGLTTREALSFSLHPVVLSRSLLPQYVGSLFTEYAAFLPVAALLLAVLGGWGWKRDRRLLAFGLIALTGLIFALGLFSPFYQVLVRLPFFDLFRVPARWLVLYAFGVALLAGAGLESLILPPVKGERSKAVIVGAVTILALVIWGFLSAFLAAYLATGSEIEVQTPEPVAWLLWIGELIFALVVVLAVALKRRRLAIMLLFASSILVLFVFSKTLPYNQLTTPEAYSDLRPPSTRIQAYESCAESEGECQSPPGRVLSLSNIFFDPGDMPEIHTAYAGLISEEALYQYTIAIKQKEILAPDLTMLYGIHSVDGFDGGLLPLEDYITLVSLILPQGSTARDGRLREYLEVVPEDKWLDLFNARYLITDKVGDEWRDGVFFDKQHPLTLDTTNPLVKVGYIPDFMSTEMWLISSEPTGRIDVSFEGGGMEQLEPEPISHDLYKVEWLMPAVPESISFLACETAGDHPEQCAGTWKIEAASLVDAGEDVFMPLALGQYRLTHSGDVKIYENLDVLPRAFFVHLWREARDVESSIAMMSESGFDPRKSAVVTGLRDGALESSQAGTVEYLKYQPEHYRLLANSEEGGLLVITDAYYPGWQATIDGDAAEIVQANGLFRGLVIPPGRHEVALRYDPASLKAGFIMSSLGFFILIGLFVVPSLRRFSQPPSEHP